MVTSTFHVKPPLIATAELKVDFAVTDPSVSAGIKLGR
jgi:hypothetical protein